MPSVVGLLEQHELAARRRVDGLREEADRIQAELAAAEQEWLEWTIARERVGAGRRFNRRGGRRTTGPCRVGSRSRGRRTTRFPRWRVRRAGRRAEVSQPLAELPVWRAG